MTFAAGIILYFFLTQKGVVGPRLLLMLLAPVGPSTALPLSFDIIIRAVGAFSTIVTVSIALVNLRVLVLMTALLTGVVILVIVVVVIKTVICTLLVIGLV